MYEINTTIIFSKFKIYIMYTTQYLKSVNNLSHAIVHV